MYAQNDPVIIKPTPYMGETEGAYLCPAIEGDDKHLIDVPYDRVHMLSSAAMRPPEVTDYDLRGEFISNYRLTQADRQWHEQRDLRTMGLEDRRPAVGVTGPTGTGAVKEDD